MFLQFEPKIILKENSLKFYEKLLKNVAGLEIVSLLKIEVSQVYAALKGFC